MNKPGLALDIDETLSWTIGWWVERLQEKFGNPEKLTVKQLIDKYRYTQKVPYWQTKEALQWMKDHQEDDSIQEELPLIENANKMVQKVSKIIPIKMYLTTRPACVKRGTKKWLKKHNFPDLPIVARPKGTVHKDGNKWKASVLVEKYPEITGIIDDNPNLVENLPKTYKGTVFLYDNTKSPRKDLDVIPCKTWKAVYTSIVRKYEN